MDDDQGDERSGGESSEGDAAGREAAGEQPWVPPWERPDAPTPDAATPDVTTTPAVPSEPAPSPPWARPEAGPPGATPPPPAWGAPPTQPQAQLPTWASSPQPPPQPPGQPPAWPPPAQPAGQPPSWGAPPPAAWGAPTPGAPAPPGARRRGWAWLWVLITTLVVLTGVAIGAVVLLVSTLTKPADATNAYLADLRSGNDVGAYSHLCAARRAETSEADFAAGQQAHVQQEGAILRFNVNYSLVHTNGHATTRYNVDRFLQLQRFEVDLVKEGGQWRLCHFRQIVR